MTVCRTFPSFEFGRLSAIKPVAANGSSQNHNSIVPIDIAHDARMGNLVIAVGTTKVASSDAK